MSRKIFRFQGIDFAAIISLISSNRISLSTPTLQVLLGTRKMGNKCPEVRNVKIALNMRKYLDIDEGRKTDDRLE